jgi:capsular polysaccharide biosynthesis protein
MKDTVSLIDIFITIKKRWKLIVLITLFAGLISGTITYFLLTPVYEASTQILVNQKNTENQIDYTLLQSNIDLINTYSVILKSPVILEKVIDKLDLTTTWEELNQIITITSQENSQVFSLIIEDPDAGNAVKIANTVSETFKEEIKSIMNVDNVSILARAELKENPSPVKPNRLLNIVIAVVVGGMTGIGIALLSDFFDNTLKDDKDVGAYLGLPVLGSIQKMSQAHKKERKSPQIQKVGSENIVS